MFLGSGFNVARGRRIDSEPRVKHLQFSYYNKFAYSKKGLPTDQLFVLKREIFSQFLEDMTLKDFRSTLLQMIKMSKELKEYFDR